MILDDFKPGTVFSYVFDSGEICICIVDDPKFPLFYKDGSFSISVTLLDSENSGDVTDIGNEWRFALYPDELLTRYHFLIKN